MQETYLLEPLSNRCKSFVRTNVTVGLVLFDESVDLPKREVARVEEVLTFNGFVENEDFLII